MSHDLLTHWFIVALAAGLVIYPVGRILGRMGLSPFLAIVAVFPFVNLVALWIVAFIDWPRPSERDGDSALRDAGDLKHG